MKGTVLYSPGDIRFEDRPDPTIVEPTDAIIRLSATCVCGSDLWPYRGVDASKGPVPMGHEYCGVVEEVGREVKHIKPGQSVVGSFFASDNTCPICKAGYQSRCVNNQYVVASALSARAPRRWHSGFYARNAFPEHGPGAAGDLGCAGHRLVRRLCRQR